MTDTAPTMKTVTQQIDDVVAIQVSDGNWNYDEYMFGMANGLLLAQSIARGTEAKFLDAPAVWLRDIPQSPTPTVSSN